MRLIENVTRKYKDKEYKKYSVVIPNKLIEELNWKAGTELEASVKNNKLIIDFKSTDNLSTRKNGR